MRQFTNAAIVVLFFLIMILIASLFSCSPKPYSKGYYSSVKQRVFIKQKGSINNCLKY